MSVLFIEYPKCSTCQKAKRWLQENNIEFEDRNIVEQVPSAQELEKWIKQSNKEIKSWFNTSGIKYRELNLKEKLQTISDEEKIGMGILYLFTMGIFGIGWFIDIISLLFKPNPYYI